jgi:hypothetical protein
MAKEPDADPGMEGAWELQRRLDGLARQRRRLEHELRVAESGSTSAVNLKERLDEIDKERRDLLAARQAQYAR